MLCMLFMSSWVPHGSTTFLLFFFIVFLRFVEVDSGWNHDHSRQARSGGVIVYRQECLGCAERHPKSSKASINIGALRR